MFGLFKRSTARTAVSGLPVTVSITGQGLPHRVARNRQRLARLELAIAGLKARKSTDAVVAKLKVLDKEARLYAILMED